MSRLLFLLLSFLLIFQGFSQTSNGYYIRQFNTENGLPSNGVKGIEWDDESGFLWIATEAGIVRYNGMDFKVYNKEDDPHITNERILFMIKNNAKRIYAADSRGNLFYVAKNQLRFFGYKPLNIDSGNNFISTSVSDILYKTRINFKKAIYSLQFDKAFPVGDTATFVLHANDLMYYSISQRSPVYAFADHKKIDYGFKLDNRIFIIINKKIFLLDERTMGLELVEIVEDGQPFLHDLKQGIFHWENGMRGPVLFIKEKAWSFAFANGRLSAHLICDKVPVDALIRYVQYDEKRKTLFLGTDSKGVFVLEEKRVESLKLAGMKPTERTSYYSQYELPDGNIMTNEGHILGRKTPNSRLLPIKGRFNNNILLIGDSILYFAQTDANSRESYLRSYHFGTGISTVFPQIREEYLLLIANSGNKIFLDRDSGLFQLRGDSVELIYRYQSHQNPGLHYDFREISDGMLAIATCNSLLRFDINKKILDTIYNAGNYCVRTVWQYKEYTFFGTYGGGLFIYKNGEVRPLPLDKSQYLLFTHCFVNDGNGFVWISTNRGLFKASIQELIDAYEKHSTEVYYYYYGKNDGMEMTELNGGCTPCALVKKDKTISFPTMDGLLWVDPAKAQSILPAGEIFIDDVLVDNKYVNPDSLKLIELPVRTSEIVIRLGISAWTNKENIYLWYRVNQDSTWRPINIERGVELRFNNLPQGKYHIQVKKRNGFGVDNYSYKEIEFSITIPWYKKYWFYALVALAIAGLVMLYINLRTRQLKSNQVRLQKLVDEKTRELKQKNEVLEKNDTIKTRLISIISHDIVTPLKFLTAAGKNLIEKRKQMPEALQDETIAEMANTSQDLQLLSTNILNWIKYQNENRRLTKEQFNLHELVNQVFGVLKSLAKQKQNELLNEVDENVTIHQYFEPLRIIIYNLVSNAINFTEQGNISVRARFENGKTIVVVSDEGVGMTTEQIQNVMADQFIISSVNIDNRKGNGLGYLIIKDLLKMMDGSFQIHSEKGQGTSVSIITNSKNS